MLIVLLKASLLSTEFNMTNQQLIPSAVTQRGLIGKVQRLLPVSMTFARIFSNSCIDLPGNTTATG